MARKGIRRSSVGGRSIWWRRASRWRRWRRGTFTSPPPGGVAPRGGEPACKDVEPDRAEPLEVADETVDDDRGRAGAHGIGSGQLTEVRPLARAVRHEHGSRFALGERSQHRRDGALLASRRHGAARKRAASRQPGDTPVDDPAFAGGVADP
jgi:hypothetical protein